ncbi:hypothetical protein IMAU10228_00834 [Lactiplantibacillus plantarum]|nr:hypothetical protein [Lactiplantibacillus plantarum]
MAELADKVAELSRDIDYLKSKINGHVGEVGERAHGLPQSGSAGFMPYGLYQSANGLFVNRRSLKAATDIATLDPGFYMCPANLLSDFPSQISSTDELVTLDVSKYKSTSIQYTLREAWLNRIWTKTLHAPDASSDASKSTGWRKLSSLISLWNGASSSGTATLSQTLDAFRKVEVLYRDGANHRYSCVVGKESVGNFTLTAVNFPDSGGVNIRCSEMNVAISGTSLSIKSNNAVILTASSSSRSTESRNLLYLNEIIGRG